MRKRCTPLFVILFFVPAFNCLAQTAQTKLTEEQFRKFDKNQSGWLSGNELLACGCKNFDGDGDNEVTQQEFFAGQGLKLASTRQATGATEAKSLEFKDGSGNNNIQGAWWFTVILYADGTDYVLRNRQSGLDLHANGTYTLNTWLGGANNMRTAGTYTVLGSKLTLNEKGGDKKVYQFKLGEAGSVITLIAPDKSGYKAERSKK
ncbi:MAG: hypothetical protein WKF70_04015 [Chitinophagaceae bacterium]